MLFPMLTVYHNNCSEQMSPGQMLLHHFSQQKKKRFCVEEIWMQITSFFRSCLAFNNNDRRRPFKLKIAIFLKFTSLFFLYFSAGGIRTLEQRIKSQLFYHLCHCHYKSVRNILKDQRPNVIKLITAVIWRFP